MIRTVQQQGLWKVEYLAYPIGGGRTYLDSIVVRAVSKDEAMYIFNIYRNPMTSSPPIERHVTPLEILEEVL